MTHTIPDQNQRHQALDPSKSFIIQAPAGSGKTELLIQRLLTLLTQVNAPEEILAITFTKKAANEMRQRILDALKQAHESSEPDAMHAKKTWLIARKVLQRDQMHQWHLLQNPNQLRIQTIDALCTFLTRQLPILSHFGSQPEIAEDPSALYSEAVEEVLMHVEEHYEWSQAVAELLLHLDNDFNKLQKLLVHLLSRRDQWINYIHMDVNDAEMRSALEKHLANTINDTLRTVYDLFPKSEISNLLSIARFAADHVFVENNTLRKCRNLIALPEPDYKVLCEWRGLAQLLMTKSFNWRKRFDKDIGFPPLSSIKNSLEKEQHLAHRENLAALIKTLTDHTAFKTALTALAFLPDATYQDEQWQILKALLHVLKIVVAQLRVVFKQHRKIDFIENAQAALFALGHDEHPTDLALALDYRIQHLLIDEFQDTSITQYQLIEKLITGWENNDGRTLFVVGDPMQSIYRFREAEVGLFIRMMKFGIGHIELIPLVLAVNFRSSPAIVNWNNKHFKEIFPSYNDIATGAVSFSPSTALPTPEEEGVEVKGFISQKELIQAEYAVQVIQERKKLFPNEKIAILVRSRSHLVNIIPLIKNAGIPYRAIDIDLLASRQYIQDLLALTCAMLHPADRIAWLSILRAPWCGLSLADLYLIANHSPHETLISQLMREDILARLSSDGQKQLTRILPILLKKFEERERNSLRSWIETTWLLLGGPGCLPDKTALLDTNTFFNLLDEINQNNQLINLENLKDKIKQLYATSEGDEQLQLMTIHSAKGLEFDTVILPHLERTVPYDESSLFLWIEQPLTNDKNALLLAPIHAVGSEQNALYHFIKRQQKVKNDYEIDRLFYVATTRAKKKLILLFNTEEKTDQDYKVPTGSFLEKLWPFIKHETNSLIINESCQDETITKKQISKPINRLIVDWENPVLYIPGTKVIAHQKQTGFQLRETKLAIIGTVTHRILQQISQLGMAWWQTASKQEQEQLIQYQLLQNNIHPNEIDAGVHTIVQSIEHTMNDDRGRWILMAHQNAQSELALSAIIDGVPERLIIDRTFIDEKGIRWIIDYKTTAFTKNDIQLFLDREQKKYRIKMQKYQQAFQLTNDGHIRLGLYFPALPAWHEWETPNLI